MAIKGTVKIDAGLEMDVYIRILDLGCITNHYSGGQSVVIVRGYIEDLIDNGEYTDFHGSNPPPYAWGGESGKHYKVNIDVSSNTPIYEQAYHQLTMNPEFLTDVKNPSNV